MSTENKCTGNYKVCDFKCQSHTFPCINEIRRRERAKQIVSMKDHYDSFMPMNKSVVSEKSFRTGWDTTSNFDRDFNLTQKQKQTGRWTPKKKSLVHRKTDGICYLCRQFVSYQQMTIDHHTAQSKGGGNNLGNLFATHGNCNQEKGDREVDYPHDLISDWYKEYKIKHAIE